MKKPSKTYNQFTVVKVPFPFTDKNTSKRRPALILTPAKLFNAKIGASICAMITTSNISWPMDIPIQDLEQAGLPAPSVIRMKLFTLDHRLIIGVLGHLKDQDQDIVSKQLQSLFKKQSSRKS